MKELTKNPLISVIMTVYNADKYLRSAIDSVLRQTYENFELIIVNDGSTDQSQKIIDHYAKIDSRIIAVHQKNMGVVAASNTAANLAHGKFLSKADADDISFDNKLMDLVNCANNNPKSIVISGSIEVINEDGEFIYREQVLTRNSDIKRALYLRNPLPNGATMIKKEAFDLVGGYSNVFAEDCNLWTKLYKIGEFSATGTTIYSWRINTKGLTMSNKDRSIHKEKEYLNKIWIEQPPKVIKRSEIVRISRQYAKHNKFGNQYESAFLFDIARISIEMIKRNEVFNGIRQLFAISTSNKKGFRIAINRIRVTIYNLFKFIFSKRGLN